MSTTLKLSVSEYERMVALGSFSCLERRIEFIRGELREMSPAGPVHEDYIEFLLSWAAPLLAANRYKVRSQSGLLIGNSVPKPDFTLLAPKRYGRNRPTADDVLLIVEVAESSLNYDLGEKAQLYAEGGVSEYWVVDVAGQTLHRHQAPSESGYRDVDVVGGDAKLQAQFEGAIAIDLAELFLSS